MSEVACLGILVADVVAYPIVRLPEEGKLALVDNMELHTGGCATNTGSALRKLGIDTAVMGKVGVDAFGDFIISQLKERDVEISGITRDHRTKTSSTMVLVSENGERTFIHYTGANATIKPEDINWNVIRNARFFHLGGFFLMPGFDGEPAAEVLKQAKSLGIKTSIDTAWDDRGRWMELLGPCLPYTDVLFTSESEAKMLTNEKEPSDIAKKLRNMGPKIVAVKLGPDGSFVSSPDFVGHIPAFKVKAVDGTGAGDAFVAGFLAGLVKGWDLRQTTIFANAVGAMCVSQAGAFTGIKTLEETLAFIEGARL
ncbi:MAG: carbohydrate kinase family protein [Firmicutes bacterium]|nr:carbohydrate kinase family protein [Bacillota bacterium]